MSTPGVNGKFPDEARGAAHRPVGVLHPVYPRTLIGCEVRRGRGPRDQLAGEFVSVV